MMMQKTTNRRTNKLSWTERREMEIRNREERLQRLSFEQRMLLQRW